MEIAVQTGATRAGSGMTLVARALVSGRERAILLLHARERRGAGDTLEDECVEILRHALLDAEGEPWARLDGTLKELNGLFKGMMVAGGADEIHAVVGYVDTAGALHVSHAGRGEAWLLRSGSVSQITESTRGKPVSNFVHISSGVLEPGDTVVCATTRLMRVLTPVQLSQLAQVEGAVDDLGKRLQAEGEASALAILSAAGVSVARRAPPPAEPEDPEEERTLPRRDRRGRRRGRGRAPSWLGGVVPLLTGLLERLRAALPVLRGVAGRAAKVSSRGAGRLMGSRDRIATLSDRAMQFLRDFRHPERRRRAQLLLVAAALGTFLVVWMAVKLATLQQRSRTQAELEQLVTQVQSDLRTAESRQISGDLPSANAILDQAEARAKQIIDSESGLYRGQAADMLSRVRELRERLNNITRVTEAAVYADLGEKNADVSALGIIGVSEAEQASFDPLSSYRIISGILNDPTQVTDGALIVDGTAFPRVQALVFLVDGGSVMELSSNGTNAVKTEDVNGWVTGKDVESYSRYLYVLSPEARQIYKYERLSNRYSAPVNYNVNGDLTGALDMVIDTSVYVLKQGGEVVKLLRGQAQPFAVRGMPAGLLKTASRFTKLPGGNFYFLDPTNKRIVVTTDGGREGESSYVRQYVLDDPSVEELKDFIVDPGERTIYVQGESKVYKIDTVR